MADESVIVMAIWSRGGTTSAVATFRRWMIGESCFDSRQEHNIHVSYPINTRILYVQVKRPGCETGLWRLRMWEATPPRPHAQAVVLPEPFNSGIKSLRATLPDETFLLGNLLLEPCISLIYAWKPNKYTNYSFSLIIIYGSSYMCRHYIAILGGGGGGWNSRGISKAPLPPLRWDLVQQHGLRQPQTAVVSSTPYTFCESWPIMVES
jgi:hypothetical protein